VSHAQFIQDGFEKRLSHTIEEAGEFLAAAGKTQRFGLDSVNPLIPLEQRETNRAWLLRETEDLLSAIHRMLESMQ